MKAKWKVPSGWSAVSMWPASNWMNLRKIPSGNTFYKANRKRNKQEERKCRAGCENSPASGLTFTPSNTISWSKPMTQFLLPNSISPKTVPSGNQEGVPETAGIPEEEAECRGRATSTNREWKEKTTKKTTQSEMQVAGRTPHHVSLWLLFIKH